jgi:hypothetical protein
MSIAETVGANPVSDAGPPWSTMAEGRTLVPQPGATAPNQRWSMDAFGRSVSMLKCSSSGGCTEEVVSLAGGLAVEGTGKVYRGEECSRWRGRFAAAG